MEPQAYGEKTRSINVYQLELQKNQGMIHQNTGILMSKILQLFPIQTLWNESISYTVDPKISTLQFSSFFLNKNK